MATLSVRRRAAAVLMAAAGALGVAGLCWPHTAAAQEPDVAAWWNAANLGDPAPAPPAPPDVDPGDLLVQGSNTVPTPGAPVTSAPGSAQAVAGLEFDLQSTDVVGALTLGIDGTAPPQVVVPESERTGTSDFVRGCLIATAKVSGSGQPTALFMRVETPGLGSRNG